VAISALRLRKNHLVPQRKKSLALTHSIKPSVKISNGHALTDRKSCAEGGKIIETASVENHLEEQNKSRNYKLDSKKEEEDSLDDRIGSENSTSLSSLRRPLITTTSLPAISVNILKPKEPKFHSNLTSLSSLKLLLPCDEIPAEERVENSMGQEEHYPQESEGYLDTITEEDTDDLASVSSGRSSPHKKRKSFSKIPILVSAPHDLNPDPQLSFPIPDSDGKYNDFKSDTIARLSDDESESSSMPDFPEALSWQSVSSPNQLEASNNPLVEEGLLSSPDKEKLATAPDSPADLFIPEGISTTTQPWAAYDAKAISKNLGSAADSGNSPENMDERDGDRIVNEPSGKPSESQHFGNDSFQPVYHDLFDFLKQEQPKEMDIDLKSSIEPFAHYGSGDGDPTSSGLDEFKPKSSRSSSVASMPPEVSAGFGMFFY